LSWEIYKAASQGQVDRHHRGGRRGRRHRESGETVQHGVQWRRTRPTLRRPCLTPAKITRRTALILIAFIAMTSAAYAECLSSAREVWREHPGSHATWRGLPGHEGVKCWFASLSKTKRMVADTSRDAAREVRSLSATAAPLLHPRSPVAPRKT